MAEAASNRLRPTRHWKAWSLVALGCAFWLIPLAEGVRLVGIYGFFDGSGWLLGVPAAMIALTMLTGWQAARSPSKGAIVTGASVIAIMAAIWWLAILGQGI